MGGFDIFVSQRGEDGYWGVPENLGYPVNTPDDEVFYVTDSSGTYGYYSAIREGGLGAKDIYMMKRQGSGWKQWSVAQNMGNTVNTARTESGLFIHPTFHLAILSAAGQNQSNADLMQLEIAGRMPDQSLLADAGRFGIPVPSGTAPSDTIPALVMLAAEPPAPLSEDSLEKESIEEKVSPPPPPVVAMLEEKKALPNKEESTPRPPAPDGLKMRNGLQLSPISASLAGNFEIPAPMPPATSRVEKVMVQVTAADAPEGLTAALQNQQENLRTDEKGYTFFYRLKGDNTSIDLSAVGFKSLRIEAKAGMNSIELQPGASFGLLAPLSELISSAEYSPSRLTAPQKVNAREGAFWLAMDLVDQESGLAVSGLLSLRTASETLKYVPEGSIDLALPPQRQAYLLEISAPGYQSLELEISQPGILRLALAPKGMGTIKAKGLVGLTDAKPQWKAPAPKSRSILPASSLYSLSLRSEGGDDVPNVQLQNQQKEEAGEWESYATTWVSTQKPERLKILAAGHFPQWIEADSWISNPHQEISLKPIRSGENFVLSRLVFEQGTINFSDSTVIEKLDRLVDMMQSTEELEILLTGYTDNQGIVRENMELSQERADAVKAYLVSKGVAQERIETRGLGPSNPIASNANPETRALNRRVECTIVKASD
jgi:outer membrane protein OmpA-like peptidoglycan-associated protein